VFASLIVSDSLGF